MMNREYMKQTYAGNIDGWRAYRAEIAAAREKLSEIIEKYRFGGGTPAQAAQELSETIGKKAACEIIASAVNAHEHDGRLSPEVAKWAQEIGWDWEMSCNLGLCCDNIHMCHINQTAEALMNLPKEPEQPETEPAEADETETNEQEETKMKNAEFIAALTAQLASVKNRSAWDRGVQQYAEDFAAELAENLNGGYISLDDLRTGKGAEEAMLNGADNWNQYSYGGSSYIYDWDIARILCTPSELKRTRNGERNPNSRETWLDVQARALFQACNRTKKAIRRAFEAVEEVH